MILQIRRCTNRCTVCPSDLTFVIPAYSMECVRPTSKMVRIATKGLIYQIDPREAVPEVSKSKGYINQEKMCL